MRVYRGEARHLRGDGPPHVIAPASVDEQHARRVALLLEAMSPAQSKRGLVSRLNAVLQPVQAKLLEGVPQHQPQAFRHVALTGRGREGRVDQAGGLEASPDDVVDGDVASYRAAAAHAHQQALGGWAGEARQVNLELLRRAGHGVPRMVQAHASPGQFEEFVLIVVANRPQDYPGGLLRRPSYPRPVISAHNPAP